MKATRVGFDLGGYVIIESDQTVTMTVDGTYFGTADQPKLFVWGWGSSHKVAMPQTVNASRGSRLVSTGWNDGRQELVRTIVADKPGTYVAQFKRQHQLDLVSPYDNPIGSGWYDEPPVNVHVDSSYMFVMVFDGYCMRP